jgi:hypothetical protein
MLALNDYVKQLSSLSSTLTQILFYILNLTNDYPINVISAYNIIENRINSEYGDSSEFFTTLLENSELNDPEHRQKFEIKFTKIHSSIVYNVDTEESTLHENVYLVRSTSTMPADDLIKGWMLYWLINNFHCQGWTQIYARFLHVHYNVSYEMFYTKLLQAIQTGHLDFVEQLYYQTMDNVIVYLDDNIKFIKENRKNDLSHDVQNYFYERKNKFELMLLNFVKENFNLDESILKSLFIRII